MTDIIFHADDSEKSLEIERRMIEKEIKYTKYKIPPGVVGPLVSIVMDSDEAMEWVRKM